MLNVLKLALAEFFGLGLFSILFYILNYISCEVFMLV